LSMFPASARPKNPAVKQVLDAIITSNKSENLVRFAKSLQ
jgi:hypothetical protein